MVLQHYSPHTLLPHDKPGSIVQRLACDLATQNGLSNYIKDILIALRLLVFREQIDGLGISVTISGQPRLSLLCAVALALTPQNQQEESLPFLQTVDRSLRSDAVIGRYPQLRQKPARKDSPLVGTHYQLHTAPAYSHLASYLHRGLLRLLAEYLAGDEPDAAEELAGAVSQRLHYRNRPNQTLTFRTQSSYLGSFNKVMLLTDIRVVERVITRGPRYTRQQMMDEDDDPPESEITPDAYSTQRMAEAERQTERALKPGSTLLQGMTQAEHLPHMER